MDPRDEATDRDVLLLCKRDEGLLAPEEEAELVRRLRENRRSRQLMYEHYMIGNEVRALLSGRSWQMRPALTALREHRARRLQFAAGLALAGSIALAVGVFTARRPREETTAQVVEMARSTAEKRQTAERPAAAVAPAVEESTTTIAEPASPAPAPGKGVLVSLDFEEGVAPPQASVNRGAIVPCPNAERGQHCLIGGLNFAEADWQRYTASVQLKGDARVPFRPGLVLRFWYWADEGLKELGVRLWIAAKSEHHATKVTHIVTGRWALAEVALDDLVPKDGTSAPLAPGDLVEHIHINPVRSARKVFYIDSLELAASEAVPGDERPR